MRVEARWWLSEWKDPVHDDATEANAGIIFNIERRFDRLVDRGLFGKRDQHRRTSLMVG